MRKEDFVFLLGEREGTGVCFPRANRKGLKNNKLGKVNSGGVSTCFSWDWN
jgi:hypothetical protein